MKDDPHSTESSQPTGYYENAAWLIVLNRQLEAMKFYDGVDQTEAKPEALNTLTTVVPVESLKDLVAQSQRYSRPVINHPHDRCSAVAFCDDGYASSRWCEFDRIVYQIGQ